MKNVGKKFEGAFKSSVPDYCLVQRLNDAPQSFMQSKNTRFAPKTPCDYFVFNPKQGILYCIECKTTHYRSISYENINVNEQNTKMIHKHQILGLQNLSQYDNVIAGFIFNFRDEERAVERTYFQNIKDFLRMYHALNKSSCNEIDLVLYGAVKIDGIKKRVNYQWDIDSLFQTLGGK